MINTIVWRLISSLESIVILCGLVYMGLFIYNPELLEELKVMILGESFRSKVTRKSLELPPELTVEKTMKVLGKEIPNPMGALENLNDPAVQKYLHAQQEATDDFVEDKLSNIMKSFYDRYKTAVNYENLENPICFGQTYFFFKRIRPELQQYSLFATKDLNQEASLVFDPNTIRFASSDSSSTDITDGMPFIHATWISDDGFRMAYGYTESIDSRKMNIRVRDLRQRKDLSVDLLTNCCVDYTSVAWIDSRTGFFYTTQVTTAKSASSRHELLNRLMFHRVGTAQEEDFMVFETVTDFDSIVIQPRITSDGHYLLLEIFRRKREVSYQAFWRNVITEHSSVSPVGNKVYYYDLSKFDGTSAESIGPCIKLIDTFSFRFDYISNIEEDFWFRTNYRAPNFRVVRITLPNIDVYNEDELVHMTFQLLNAWKQCLDWIPQRLDGDYLESANIAAHTVMVLKYLRNASHEVLLYDLTQNLLQESQIPVADLPHPPYGTITGPNCNFYSAEIFYQFSDFAEASSIYRVLIDRHPYTGTIEISFHEVHSTIVPGIVDKYAFTTIQETCETKRNIYVPMLISGLREVLEDDNRGQQPKPCIVCVHGGFGMPLTPKLSLPFLLFAQVSGGLVVTVNVQGAGIYGTSYAEHGRKEEKESAVLDLAYVLRHLVKKRYTTHQQIALFGGTFNGTLIGSAMAQFPSLFASAVIYDGVFDLLRYQLYNAPVQYTAPPGAKDTPTIITWQERAAQLAKRPWSHWTSTTWYQEFGGCFPPDEECFTSTTTGNDPTAAEMVLHSHHTDGHQAHTPPSTPSSSTVKRPHPNTNNNNINSSGHKPAPVRPHHISPEQFQAQFLKLSAMSPLHQVGKPVAGALRTCPAVLLVADYCDDKFASTSTTIASKVSCIHSVKFAAQLQKCYYNQHKGEIQPHEQQPQHSQQQQQHQQMENKPILLHLVGFETQQSNDDTAESDTAAIGQQAPHDTQQRVAVATMSMEEICRIFAFMIHTTQAPWPVSAHSD